DGPARSVSALPGRPVLHGTRQNRGGRVRPARRDLQLGRKAGARGTASAGEGAARADRKRSPGCEERERRLQLREVMNPSQLNPTAPNLAALNLQQTLGDFAEIKENALTSLQKSFRVLAKMPAAVASSDAAARTDGLPNLDAPTVSRSVNDLTLRIGLLQDALNQLMAQVSKTEIRQRMSELQKENQRQLEKFEQQMAKAAEAAEKAKEAQKKGNIFEAVGNWIQAAVAVVSAVVTMVSAVGQILTNPVGAAGLIIASVA